MAELITQAATDKKELERLRKKINHPRSYGAVVAGVHTYDIAEIFKDYRAAIQIARRALRNKANDK